MHPFRAAVLAFGGRLSDAVEAGIRAAAANTLITKTNRDEIESFLGDASNLSGGRAASLIIPETEEEIAATLAAATRERTPVTISGAGTGLVGGRVPFGGVVLATHRLNKIKEIVRDDDNDDSGGRATAEAGVVLADFQRAVGAEKLFYPPDPTEWSCFLGATVATNSSGARTFKYGPTRRYIRRLKIALATGDVLDLRRGENFADARGRLRFTLGGGRAIDAQLPSYRMPETRKHAAGYYVAPGMDAIDLFIGSEGTLGVVTELEVALLAQPEGVLSGIVFFGSEDDLLAFVGEARESSLRTRETRATGEGAPDARALEYFDAEALNFLRERFPLVPLRAAGAIFFEQEITSRTEERLLGAWLALLEKHGALLNDSWFGTNEHDRAEMREFRHQLPVMVNEWLARHGQRKVSTDISVPDAEFPRMLGFYKERLRASRLQFVIFGHIGDNHVHVNIMPRDEVEAVAAREIYSQFIARAVEVRGTISAEHGVGKIKREYLRALYGDEHLREMAALKRAFDPASILGRGNIFPEELLKQ
ncbi:MAG TPA: FAD-linked oxidase C-terminal domain-containing protein [Pyrinomonadaceae bacterium]|nr:FAD-linked oxidase C-terminal domain-containing protein [Pyrinomonadaceae bacterium]